MESLRRKMEEIQGSKTSAEDELERLKRELDKEREDRQQALQRLNKVEGKLTETEEQKQAELQRQTEEREKALASVREKDAALKEMATNLQSTMDTMKVCRCRRGAGRPGCHPTRSHPTRWERRPVLDAGRERAPEAGVPARAEATTRVPQPDRGDEGRYPSVRAGRRSGGLPCLAP